MKTTDLGGQEKDRQSGRPSDDTDLFGILVPDFVKLQELDDILSEFLTYLSNVGIVHIVTSSDFGWIESVCKKLLPKTNIVIYHSGHINVHHVIHKITCVKDQHQMDDSLFFQYLHQSYKILPESEENVKMTVIRFAKKACFLDILRSIPSVVPFIVGAGDQDNDFRCFSNALCDSPLSQYRSAFFKTVPGDIYCRIKEIALMWLYIDEYLHEIPHPIPMEISSDDEKGIFRSPETPSNECSYILLFGTHTNIITEYVTIKGTLNSLYDPVPIPGRHNFFVLVRPIPPEGFRFKP